MRNIWVLVFVESYTRGLTVLFGGEFSGSTLDYAMWFPLLMLCRYMPRDHFVYAPSQWETTLHCNVSHWLGACTQNVPWIPQSLIQYHIFAPSHQYHNTVSSPSAGIILCMCPANETWCYSLIVWAHTQHYPWLGIFISNSILVGKYVLHETFFFY